MNDDLNDIDLIDRYLSGLLNKTEEKAFLGRYENEPEFRKETDLYRKIYDGIDQSESDELRKKLEGYFEEYEEQEGGIVHLDQHKNGKIIAIAWRPFTLILSGVAASFLLIGLGYWFYFSHSRPGDFQTALNHVSPLNKKDSGLKIPMPHSDGQLSAYARLDRLPDSDIRKAVYPDPLTYTFRADSLCLYGDPLIAPLGLRVFKKNTVYYLAIEDSVYELAAGKDERAASVLKRYPVKLNQTGKDTREMIALKIAAIKTSAYPNSGFQVMLSRKKGAGSYVLIKDGNLSMLVIHADFSAENCKLIEIQQAGSANWYLINAGRVFIIDVHQTVLQPLKELSVQQSAEARLFHARGPIQVPVFSLQ